MQLHLYSNTRLYIQTLRLLETQESSFNATLCFNNLKTEKSRKGTKHKEAVTDI